LLCLCYYHLYLLWSCFSSHLQHRSAASHTRGIPDLPRTALTLKMRSGKAVPGLVRRRDGVMRVSHASARQYGIHNASDALTETPVLARAAPIWQHRPHVT